jgi:hypothetical protein
MTRLLIFLGAVFYVGLALVFIVPLIDKWRATKRRTTELANENTVQKAA